MITSGSHIVRIFFTTAQVFFLLGAFCDVEVDEDGEVVSTPITPGTPLTLAPVPPARSKIGHMERAKGWAQPQSAGAGEQAPLLDGSINDKVPLQPSEPDLVPMVGPIPPFPVSLLVAVVVDAFVDGFLIGISSASGSKAGVIMTVRSPSPCRTNRWYIGCSLFLACSLGNGLLFGCVMYSACCSSPRGTVQIALTIEMGFLGMTFASTLSKQPLRRSLPSIVAPPLMLIVGSATGAGSAAAVSHLPAVHVGLVSFGVAALLYLVTEELLLEAHENCHAHKWWIDMWFFVGFMASFILAKVTG